MPCRAGMAASGEAALGSFVGQLPHHPHTGMVNSRSAEKVLRAPGPFTLSSMQNGVPMRPRPAMVKKQHSSGADSNLSMTISEEGEANLAKAVEAENTVGAITGTGAEASRQDWVASEGERSRKLWQRYTRKADPRELRLSKSEIQDLPPRPANDVWWSSPQESIPGTPPLLTDALSSEGCEDPTSPPDDCASDAMSCSEASAASQTLQAPEIACAGPDAEALGAEAVSQEADAVTEEVSSRWEQWRQRKAQRKDRKASRTTAKRASCPGMVGHNGFASPRAFSDSSSVDGKLASEGDCESMSVASAASRLSTHTLESGLFQLSERFAHRREGDASWALEPGDSEASHRSWQ